MTKDDLIYLTLKQLIESFKSSPERLSIEDINSNGTHYTPSCITIVWKHRIDLDGTIIQDPNNAPKTIAVTYNYSTKQLTTNIYLRDIIILNASTRPDANATFTYRFWPQLYKSYRSFMQLKRKLSDYHKERQNIDYVKKLTSIFPSTCDDDLIG